MTPGPEIAIGIGITLFTNIYAMKRLLRDAINYENDWEDLDRELQLNGSMFRRCFWKLISGPDSDLLNLKQHFDALEDGRQEQPQQLSRLNLTVYQQTIKSGVTDVTAAIEAIVTKLEAMDKLLLRESKRGVWKPLYRVHWSAETQIQIKELNQEIERRISRFERLSSSISREVKQRKRERQRSSSSSGQSIRRQPVDYSSASEPSSRAVWAEVYSAVAASGFCDCHDKSPALRLDGKVTSIAAGNSHFSFALGPPLRSRMWHVNIQLRHDTELRHDTQLGPPTNWCDFIKVQDRVYSDLNSYTRDMERSNGSIQVASWKTDSTGLGRSMQELLDDKESNPVSSYLRSSLGRTYIAFVLSQSLLILYATPWIPICMTDANSRGRWLSEDIVFYSDDQHNPRPRSFKPYLLTPRLVADSSNKISLPRSRLSPRPMMNSQIYSLAVILWELGHSKSLKARYCERQRQEVRLRRDWELEEIRRSQQDEGLSDWIGPKYCSAINACMDLALAHDEQMAAGEILDLETQERFHANVVCKLQKSWQVAKQN